MRDEFVAAPARSVVVHDVHQQHFFSVIFGGQFLNFYADGRGRTGDEPAARLEDLELSRLLHWGNRNGMPSIQERRHHPEAGRELQGLFVGFGANHPGGNRESR